MVFEKGLMPAVIADVVDQPGASASAAVCPDGAVRAPGRAHADVQSLPVHRGCAGSVGSSGRGSVRAVWLRKRKEYSRQLFLRLVALGEGTEDTRRRVLRSELEFPIQGSTIQKWVEVIDTFGQARLLTFDHDPADARRDGGGGA